MTKKKGYTLIELIVVLALFSILLIISIPNISLLISYREYNEIKNFEKDLKYSRAKALVENTPVEFKIDVPNNKYKIIQKNKIIKEYNFKNGVKLNYITISSSKQTSGESSIVFKTTGAPSTAGTINFSTKNYGIYNVTIEVATGRINIHNVR